MRSDIFLECPSCGYKKDVKDFRVDCPRCGYPSALFQIKYSKFPQVFPLSDYTQPILRYLPIMPLEAKEIIDVNVGNTPLVHAKNLGKFLGLENLYIKDETRNASGSFKDRGAVIGVSAANVLGYKMLNVASSGNFASAIARICTLSGIKCIVLVPEDTPEEKMVMIAAYGGKVIKVKGIFDECRRLSIELSRKKNILSASWDLKPFTLEGWKTTLLEIFEQMHYTLPDVIIVPTGGGGHVLGTWKAIKELSIMKKVDKFPRIVGVQASGSAPYVKAVREGLDYVPSIDNPQTVAKSLKVSSPLEKRDVLKAIKEVDGTFIDVSDEEILEAVVVLGKMEGVFSEPGAAASIAGLKKLVECGKVDSSERVVAVVTGSGLKDVLDIKSMFGNFPLVESGSSVEHILSLV
ncbi:MAG: threonine synthase [Nitrososphaeria archaeon]|nr:threonine synthase [Nitrososphaeria archaeon]